MTRVEVLPGPTSDARGPPSGPTVTPTEHLNELLRLMEAEAANARRVDWVQARADVFAAAGAAQSIPDSYPAIAVALNRLDDFESHYRGSDGGLVGPSPEPACQPGLTETPSLPETIGYVRLNGCPCQELPRTNTQKRSSRRSGRPTGPGLSAGSWTCAKIAEATCGR